ncbi:MAG: hypothetical protein GMKNLPBB_01715 [Myxococcota bacterium]|nr:hypothetical protein [Myxococcota bacterium]
MGCGAITGWDGLLRFAMTADGMIPDVRRKLSGRGAWCHPDLKCLEAGLKKRGFAAALRCQVQRMDPRTLALQAIGMLREEPARRLGRFGRVEGEGMAVARHGALAPEDALVIEDPEFPWPADAADVLIVRETGVRKVLERDIGLLNGLVRTTIPGVFARG